MAINSIGSSGPPVPAPAAPPAHGPAPSSVKAEAAAPTPQPSQEQVQQAIESVKKTGEPESSNLEFSIDNESGKTIVSVTDAKTGEMIRQIPSQELLEIARSLDKMQGLLLRQKA